MRQTRPNPRRISGSSARELLGAHPVRQRTLQLALALGDRGRLPQRRDRGRLESEGRVVGLERPRRIALHEVGTAQGEGQLVRRRVGLAGTLENVDALRDEAALDEQLGEAHGPGRRNVRQALRVLDQRGGGGPIARLQEVGGQHEQSLGRLLERGEGRLGQLQRPLVVALLRLRAGEGHAGRRVRGVQLEDAPEDGKGQLVLPLKRVDLREVQLGPEKAGIEPDGFLEQLGAFVEPVLLNADGAQHRTGRGSRRGIGERELGLLVGFLEPPFLDEGGRPLEGRLRLGAEAAAGGRRRTGAGRGRRRRGPSRETRRPPGRDGHRSLGSPLRHDYHYQ